MTDSSPPTHRVAIVTGAAQGIGRAIALRLAADGLDVGLNDAPAREAQLQEIAREIQEKSGRRATVIACDVSQEHNVKEMVQNVIGDLGGVDVMIANAGILDSHNLGILETDAAQWDKMMSVNLRGVFLCYKYAAQQMIAQGRGGRIIGASSGYGKRAGPYAAAYSASKFGVRGLTQSAAGEWGQYGITVNAYAPGYIDTAMTRDIISERFPNPGDFLEKEAIKASLVGRNGTPEDVAALVSYLASSESHFVTGQTMSINGGYFFD